MLDADEGDDTATLCTDGSSKKTLCEGDTGDRKQRTTREPKISSYSSNDRPRLERWRLVSPSFFCFFLGLGLFAPCLSSFRPPVHLSASPFFLYFIWHGVGWELIINAWRGNMGCEDIAAKQASGDMQANKKTSSRLINSHSIISQSPKTTSGMDCQSMLCWSAGVKEDVVLGGDEDDIAAGSISGYLGFRRWIYPLHYNNSLHLLDVCFTAKASFSHPRLTRHPYHPSHVRRIRS
ncbi:hypothetical protein ACRALDRAFT_205887 [Sodiomyces alcalophilus JCM 7366]|uniref:uncharacterized protein n=1 Tax=Sodiomyces alcalophilus JCM 7366 TaxID=591952 RepID=UPI0039B61D24